MRTLRQWFLWIRPVTDAATAGQLDTDGVRGIRVLVLDDHPVVRRGLRTMLDSQAWIDRVVDTGTVSDAVRQALGIGADVIVMDILLPDGDGIEAVSRIVQARPEVKVLILTTTNDEDIVARALRAGASGYLLKDTRLGTIIDAMRTVAGGGVVLGPKIAPTMLSALQRAPAELPAPFDRLTMRERDILVRLAAGETNARIARHLGLSEKTVRNGLSAVFTKLGVGDRVQAALLARDAGFARRCSDN